MLEKGFRYAATVCIIKMDDIDEEEKDRRKNIGLKVEEAVLP